jgi:Fe-Mn family superoxide dismutase
VTKLNAAILGTAHDGQPLEAVIKAARKSDKAVFNNAAQAWNHGFYWKSMNPAPGKPSAELTAAIARDFGSPAKLVAALVEAGEKHFGSGWAWLATSKGGALAIAETHDGDTLADGATVPLLTIDVWEHAYYLDRKNERPAYLKAVSKLLDWGFASEQYAGRRWTYPG